MSNRGKYSSLKASQNVQIFNKTFFQSAFLRILHKLKIEDPAKKKLNKLKKETLSTSAKS